MSTALLWGLLGLLMGPFLNHLADRLPRHQAVSSPPACAFCGQAYPPGQWPALLAVSVGNGHCRGCGNALPARRWLLEIGLALLYGALAWRHGLSWQLLLATGHASILALVTVTDLESRIVPNAAVLPAMILTTLIGALTCPRCTPSALLGGGIGFLLFLLLAIIYPGGLGFGDVKLAGYIGLIAGYPRVLPALAVGILAGGIGAAILLLSGKGHRRSYMPYAPFLAIGGILALFSL